MTINVSDSVVIAKPVPEVFAFVADHANLPAWTVGVKRAHRLTQGPPASGSRYRVVGKLLGQSIESSYLFTGRRQVKADHQRLKTVLERPPPVADPGR